MAYTPSKTFVAFILSTISIFASPAFQRRVWIEGKGPEVSSYDEAMNDLFDFDGLFKILAGAWKNAGWTQA